MSPTHLLGESCVSKTGFCARIRGSTAPFGVNAAPSSRLAGSSAPLWGFLWHHHPTGLSQEGCGTSVLRRKGTTLFPCSPRQRKEHGAPQHVAQSKPEEHAKKMGKMSHLGFRNEGGSDHISYNRAQTQQELRECWLHQGMQGREPTTLIQHAVPKILIPTFLLQILRQH